MIWDLVWAFHNGCSPSWGLPAQFCPSLPLFLLSSKHPPPSFPLFYLLWQQELELPQWHGEEGTGLPKGAPSSMLTSTWSESATVTDCFMAVVGALLPLGGEGRIGFEVSSSMKQQSVASVVFTDGTFENLIDKFICSWIIIFKYVYLYIPV